MQIENLKLCEYCTHSNPKIRELAQKELGRRMAKITPHVSNRLPKTPSSGTTGMTWAGGKRVRKMLPNGLQFKLLCLFAENQHMTTPQAIELTGVKKESVSSAIYRMKYGGLLGSVGMEGSLKMFYLTEKGREALRGAV